ncbi:MAG: hypothetical protein QOJ53_659 [Sphingomonadales bacterium]|jgi:hypothetical protein|nr:hypothetical protein [Sphingomonadales bacterium]
MLRHVKTMLLAAALAAGSSQAWAQSIRPDPDENLQWAAAVVRIDALRNQGDATVKLFGTAGGDPAMNGLYTYLAFFESPGDGWRVFRLGDFLTYRILSEARGRVVLEIRDSVMNERTGDIGTRLRRLLVSWTAGAGGAPPATVRVTSAR